MKQKKHKYGKRAYWEVRARRKSSGLHLYPHAGVKYYTYHEAFVEFMRRKEAGGGEFYIGLFRVQPLQFGDPEYTFARNAKYTYLAGDKDV